MLHIIGMNLLGNNIIDSELYHTISEFCNALKQNNTTSQPVLLMMMVNKFSISLHSVLGKLYKLVSIDFFDWISCWVETSKLVKLLISFLMTDNVVHSKWVLHHASIW